jgi:hypothetical protein|tara:strand:- start:2666 stop:3307 length:642 start_codon:yes stop_codon:yes gene_type:complete
MQGDIMKRHIIGLCGFIGCGKGTVADILVQDHGFTKISFADKLKNGTANVFGWDRAMLEGDTKISREWRETPDEFWSKELGHDMTPRRALQLFGTDCMRNGFSHEIWVLLVKRELQENPATNFVIPDVRFFNERDMLHDMSGVTWRVKRGPDPDWVRKAISDNKYDTVWMDEYPNIHESEWRWLDDPHEYDRVIPNDSDLIALSTEIKRAVSG